MPWDPKIYSLDKSLLMFLEKLEEKKIITKEELDNIKKGKK